MPAASPRHEGKNKEANGQPRGTWLYLAAAILSLVGLSDAIYLTAKHLTGQSVQCTVTAGCEEVLSSVYATPGGYPLAAFGAAAYFAAFSLATLALFGYSVARRMLFYLVALMMLTTLFLLYVQGFVIGKWCQYCLLSAAVTFCLTGIVLAERRSHHARA